MTGLIFKDLVNLKSYIKSIALMCAVFLVISIMNESPAFFTGYIQMLSIVIILATFGYDEKVEWDHYAMTLPIKRNDIVKSKYILAYSMVLIMTIIGAVTVTVVNLIQNKDIMADGNMLANLLIASIISLVIAVVIPFTFKYGSEKGRYVMMSIIVIPLGFAALLNAMNVSMESVIQFIEILAKYPIIYPFVIIIAIGISYMFSLKIFDKKEF
ncbi:ABC-2 transporter permease [Beduini massiliensis]|uniref:ABC-2 transporter permease n=1 Tax=Beduini massiliensis TaxID=1585974 RepID=UPI00059AACAC|nr:ABC-2 transporter permease [Beduini massiliensis]